MHICIPVHPTRSVNLAGVTVSAAIYILPVTSDGVAGSNGT